MADEGFVDLFLFRVGDGGRFQVGALDETDAELVLDDFSDVVIGSVEIALEDGASLREILVGAEDDLHGALGVVGALHIDADKVIALGGDLQDLSVVGFGHFIAKIEAALGELDGDVEGLDRPICVSPCGGELEDGWGDGQALQHLYEDFGGGGGLLDAMGVFTEIVEGDHQVLFHQLLAGFERLIQIVSSDEPGDERAEQAALSDCPFDGAEGGGAKDETSSEHRSRSRAHYAGSFLAQSKRRVEEAIRPILAGPVSGLWNFWCKISVVNRIERNALIYVEFRSI